MAGLFLTAGGSQEQDIHHSTFLANKSKKNKLDDAIPKMALAIADTFSIVAGSGHIEMTSVVSTDQTFILDHVISAPQITETVITELESVIVVPVISETSQDGDQGDSGLNMDQAAGENVPIHETWMQLIARAIFIAGLLTVIAVGRTALYKSASGVVFGHNKLAYYVTLAIIFLVGVSEIFTGVWISMSSLTYKRRLWIGGLVLFLSIWPIVCIRSQHERFLLICAYHGAFPRKGGE